MTSVLRQVTSNLRTTLTRSLVTLLLISFLANAACAGSEPKKQLRVQWVASNWAAFHGLARQSGERLALQEGISESSYSHARIWPLHAIVDPENVKTQFYSEQSGINNFADYMAELDDAEYDILAVAVQLKMIAKDALVDDYERLILEMVQRAKRKQAELVLVTYANSLDGEDRERGRVRLLQIAQRHGIPVCPWWDTMRRMRHAYPEVSSFDEQVGGHPSRAITYVLSYAFYYTLIESSFDDAPVSLEVGDWSADDDPIVIDPRIAEEQRLIAWEAVEVARGKGQYQSRNGHPADFLPPSIRQVSGFGERPEWSHDGRRILFVEKPMGEVYELDLESGLIHPKTRHFHHYGFTRANYLANGEILLSGPRNSFDVADNQSRNDARHQCWLSIMKDDGNSEPVSLGTMAAEGPAVSRKSMRIAWTHRDKQDPSLGENHARHFVADIEYVDGVPRLASKKVVFDSHQLPFNLGNASLETQDFAGEDNRLLIFSVYQIGQGYNTDTFAVDCVTGEFKNLTRSPGHYDEPEGVFPDGKHVCVEHAPCDHSPWPLTDIYKLKLDGSGELQRLTYFSDFKGFKATQGVVSDDGTKLCFQIGRSGDEAGVGYGFFVMDLEAAAERFEPFQSFAVAKNATIQEESDRRATGAKK